MAEEKYLHVKNWRVHQHYRDRSPPWIKLHGNLLVDHDFTCLQDASKLHLICIWLLARHNDGVIPNDPQWVKKCAGLDHEVDLTPLIAKGFLIPSNYASNMLATCSPEAEAEAEAEKEVGRLVKEKRTARPPAFASQAEEIAQAYQRRRYDTPDPNAKYYPVLVQEATNALAQDKGAYALLITAIDKSNLPKDASFSDIAKACGLKKAKVKIRADPSPYKDFTAERLAAQLGVG